MMLMAMLILLTVIMMETPKMRYVNSLSFMMTKMTKMLMAPRAK